jgi:hypothetical protein
VADLTFQRHDVFSATPLIGMDGDEGDPRQHVRLMSSGTKSARVGHVMNIK